MSQPAIIEAFAEVEDRRRKAGQRHTLPLCLALFTLAIAAGNKGFLAIEIGRTYALTGKTNYGCMVSGSLIYRHFSAIATYQMVIEEILQHPISVDA
jgi:hypothetical protein